MNNRHPSTVHILRLFRGDGSTSTVYRGEWTVIKN